MLDISVEVRAGTVSRVLASPMQGSGTLWPLLTTHALSSGRLHGPAALCVPKSCLGDTFLQWVLLKHDVAIALNQAPVLDPPVQPERAAGPAALLYSVCTTGLPTLTGVLMEAARTAQAPIFSILVCGTEEKQPHGL